LARRDFGYGLVERHLAIVLAVALAIVLRWAVADLFVEAIRLREGTSGRFAAALLAIRAAFTADRRLGLCHAIATAQVFVNAPAPLPLIIAQVQSQLLFRFTTGTAPVGVARARIVVPLLGVEDRVPPIFGRAFAFVRIGVRAGRLSIVGTEARAPLIVPAAILTGPGGVRLPAILFPLVGAEALARLIIRPALTPGGVAGPAILFVLLGMEVAA
jgi:hypothetical protein